MQRTESVRKTKTQFLTHDLCEKLQCSEIGNDLERVNHAREMLGALQEQEILESLSKEESSKSRPFQLEPSATNISNIFEKTKQRLSVANSSCSSISMSNNELNTSELNAEEGEYEYELIESVRCDELSNDAWLGYFNGYEILKEHQECVLNENKQCVLISLNDDSSTLENYLRSGIRCFMIDLFTATELENQKIIFNLLETELKISKEYGFPITTTLLAMLSPRQQYTGIMDENNSEQKLKVSDELILTTKKQFASCSNRERVYVNANYLLHDCRVGDFILIGPDIQVAIIEILDDELKCKVMEGGVLHSRLPVRFPARCDRNAISLEELENITFAREVGINTIVSYIPGTQDYLNKLCDALHLLNCKKMRLFTRIVLNDFRGETEDLKWIAKRYDGFLVDFKEEQQTDICVSANRTVLPDLLRLSMNADQFLMEAYKMKKPIILNPLLIAERQLVVQTCNFPHIFYYPDKYLFSKENFSKSFAFHLLQNSIRDRIPSMELTQHLCCDESGEGGDIFAMACVEASVKSNAQAIVVCASMPDMAIKISHFRPEAPIILISNTKSIGDYISVYHNLIFFNFHLRVHYSYKEFVTKAFTLVLIYLKNQVKLKQHENVVLAYNNESDSMLCNKYLLFKFDDQHFPNHLKQVLFT